MRAPQYLRQVDIPLGGSSARVDVQSAGGGAAAVARSFDVAGGAIADYASQLVAARRAIELQKASGAATRELDDLNLALEQEGDWKDGAKRFEDGFNTIRKRHADTITDAAVRLQFDAVITRNFETKRVAFNRKMVDFMQADGEATVLEQIDGGVRAAMAARNDLEREQVLSGVAASITTMRDARIISPVKAVQLHKAFKGKVDEARVLRDLNVGGEDGIAAVVTRLQAGDYGNIDPERRERLINTAQQRLDTEVRRNIAYSERGERRAERDLRKAQADTEASVLARIDADPESITDPVLRTLLQQQRLSPEGYRMLINRRQGGQEGRDNPYVVTDLQTKMIRGGEDIHEQIIAARNNSQLSSRMAGELMSENKRRLDGSAKEEWKTAAERDEFSFLQRSLGRDKLQFSFDDDTAARLALAEREYRQRIQAGEKPRDVASDIVARVVRAPATLPSTYYEPPKTKDDVVTVIGRLRTLRDNGTIGPGVYDAEITKLRQIEPTLPAAAPTRSGARGAEVQKPARGN